MGDFVYANTTRHVYTAFGTHTSRSRAHVLTGQFQRRPPYTVLPTSFASSAARPPPLDLSACCGRACGGTCGGACCVPTARGASACNGAKPSAAGVLPARCRTHGRSANGRAASMRPSAVDAPPKPAVWTREPPREGPIRQPTVKDMLTIAVRAADASLTAMPRASQARRERLLVGVYAIAPPAPMRSIAVAASGKEGRRAGRRGDGPSRR
mmetsp:Transcript_1287/g.3841  ORF Transcript_1287/g.3841 Transcript_1287/m.3841 type:complete len:211 (+) Transcript_1287:1-633(+)